MATATQEAKLSGVGKLTMASQRAVIEYSQSVLVKRQQFNELSEKMDAIDIAYARYKASTEESSDGVDSRSAETVCNIFAADDITPPIVVSQVDSYVAYLSEVFLSGSPLFPVVSSPAKRSYAEVLESIIDDHASIGGYARQLLLFFRDGCKYNFAACEIAWDAIDQFSVFTDLSEASAQAIKRKPKKYNRLTRLNPRNVVWDYSLAPGDVSEQGDYAGFIELISKTKLKRKLNKWSGENKAYNVIEAMNSGGRNAGAATYFHHDPQISEYVTSPGAGRDAAADWEGWFEGKSKGRRGPRGLGGQYELFTLYARIMPADFGITAPSPNTPQIWKFVICNGTFVVHADRVISAFDYLPILFGQPLEDGLGYQTQSIAEGEIPFQQAANTLFNIRFASARRAVSDRALYIPGIIKPSDINSPVAAPKIPVNISALSNLKLGDTYHQIPFDLRGTETAIQDASVIVQFSKELHGVNSPRQGQFQKGNKSVQEWNDTMGGSDGRMRLPALTLEHQFFSPLKSIIGLNILQYGEDGTVTSQVTGNDLEVKIAELRAAKLSFKIADGYTPKSKLASTEVILAGIQLVGSSPLLQQAYGSRLPGMFAHFMSLSGAKGFEEYDPQNQANQQAPAGVQNLPANNLQQAAAMAQQPAVIQPDPMAGPAPIPV
jgi:hypothetical protein